ncbi:hypothetical protein [Paraflavitalea speifideaquila]|nr:hypothetical protein [Paraflavitalea speifideiaquila]
MLYIKPFTARVKCLAAPNMVWMTYLGRYWVNRQKGVYRSFDTRPLWL